MRKTISGTSGHSLEGKMESSSIRSLSVLIAAVLIMAGLLAACGSATSEPTSAPGATIPAETVALSGEQLLEARCTVCHTADWARQASKTSDQWDAIVTRMIGKGAQLADDEKAVLVEYLAATYGP